MRNRAYEQMRKRMVESSKAKRIPILGHFELTARCNLDCKMCYVHTQDNALALKKELTTEQWKRIFDEAYDAGMLFASLSGGECTIRKDFKELYLHLWNKRVMITVMTNGTLLNDEYIEFFATYKPEMIQISLYGSSEEGYLNVTGHKGFEKAVTAIEKLEKAGIDVRVVSTPSKYMVDDYIKTLTMCKEKGFYTNLTDITLAANRDDPDKDDYFLSDDEVFDLTKRRAELFGAIKEPIENPPEPSRCTENPPAKGLTCNAGNALATVIWDGRMYPCSNMVVGEGYSLLEMSYEEAWEKTKQMADGVVYGAECVGCPYDKTCTKCPTFRLKDLHSGRCNPNMCEMTRRLVAAGIKEIVRDTAPQE